MLKTSRVIAAMGVMLLVLLPRSDVRWQRLSSRGGAAMLIGLDLYGSVHPVLTL